MALIGIDLGTTNSLVTAYQNGEILTIPNGTGQFMTKSAIGFLDDGTILVGENARLRLLSHPKDTVAYFKQFMGTEHSYSVRGQSYSAHELSALLLAQLKEDAERFLGEAVTEAIISVPAYFNDHQRSATKCAAALAGLKVNRLINEPSAAALYHRYTTGITEGKLLVIDFGGGTLDVSVVDCFEEMVEILAISGDNHLGGKDIDQAIAQYVCHQAGLSEASLSVQKAAVLQRNCEQAKIALSTVEETWVCVEEQTVSLTRPTLAELCAPLFARVKEVIVQAVQLSGISIREITDIVLVGGSSMLPIFSDYLERIFGARPKADDHAEYMVANGLALCCGIKNRSISDVFMTDVCPFSLGTGVHNPNNPSRPKMAVLLSRCSVLPASVTRRFYTTYDGQAEVKCSVCQGEHLFEDENLKLAEFTLRVPPAPAGQSTVALTFTYTVDGILQVRAQASGGDHHETLIVHPKLNLTDEELSQRIAELSELRACLSDDRENQLLLASLEQLYHETTGELRDYIAYLHREFERTMETGGYIARRKRRQFVQQRLDALESTLTPTLWMDFSEDEE